MLQRFCRHPLRFTVKLIRLFAALIGARLDAAQLGIRKKQLTLPQKNQWQSKWSKRILRAMDIQVTHHGSPPTKGMLVSNHLSYLDIMAISTALPATFLSKAEVRKWPLIGPLTEFAGTLFVKRERKSDLQALTEAFSAVWQKGSMIVMFPEGTSSNGDTVLPFKSSLLKPACDEEQLVTPAFVSYKCEEGSLKEDVYFWRDMAFAPHLMRLLSVKSIHAHVTFGQSQLPQKQDRKSLTRSLWEEVKEMHSTKLKKKEINSAPMDAEQRQSH
ncbi:MAG: 1-acyl-sn-glycerol-3-phosphate acyltransferase [Verrucomicrobia bacterium]|jgi:lyso-ornithine lipid O-acyltransferase|nr:1-acyl-sn-glycerol-3-phosphate acyltransferase [Verrucomicrobiota bacterium]